MKVTDALKKGSPTLSFEFFPPKTPEQEARLFETLMELKKFHPDFVSVTYGAMGRTREKSFFWVGEIKAKYGLEPVAHLTCVNASKADIAGQLDKLDQLGITNILALRGDPPEGEKDFIPPQDGFRFAKELIAFIKQQKPHFCVGAAGFPEAATEEYLQQKIAAGAEYVITQLFFDNRYYFDFVERCKKAGVKVPIIPGLMPITSYNQIKRMTDVCCATIPLKLLEQIEKVQDDPEAVTRIGAAHTVAQAHGLLKAGVPGLHFFVMNQAEPITTILSQLPR